MHTILRGALYLIILEENKIKEKIDKVSLQDNKNRTGKC